jgi:hypothetical protein
MDSQVSRNFDICPVCNANVRSDNLKNHIVKVHLLQRPELHSDFMKSISNGFADDAGLLLTCIHCNLTIKKGRLPGHFLRSHLGLYEKSVARADYKNSQHSQGTRRLSTVVDAQTGMPDVAADKFAEYLNRGRLIARKVERCECRKPIVFVDVQPGKLKAFDVDSHNRLTDSHSCDGPKSESIHAFNGGAVDSNRRKH